MAGEIRKSITGPIGMENEAGYMVASTDPIETFNEKIAIIISVGEKLLEILDRDQSIPQRNLIVYAFLRKTVRLSRAIGILIAAEYEEEAQILTRALIETRINCDYFLLTAKEDWKDAAGRMVAALMLDKMKALRATNFMLGGQQVDKEKWEGIEKEIRDSYGDELFAELKQYGFSGVSLETRATRTGNQDLYQLAYRLYSRNVHATDIHEQLGRRLTGEVFAGFEETLLPAVLEAVWSCAGTVVDKCMDWLGDPLGLLP